MLDRRWLENPTGLGRLLRAVECLDLGEAVMQVYDAVRASGLLQRHPEIDLGRHRIGIYGRVVAKQAPLADGDRVEVYRPLLVDPKEARRRRALRKA